MSSTSTPPLAAALEAWQINARITAYLIEHLPPEIWAMALPGIPRRTVRALAAHLHNTRILWVKSLGSGEGLPARVNPATVTPENLRAALDTSEAGISSLIRYGINLEGTPAGGSSGFVYGAIPRHVVSFVAYAAAHEGHHRGQLVLAARQLGHRLPEAVVSGLWQWSSRLREL